MSCSCIYLKDSNQEEDCEKVDLRQKKAKKTFFYLLFKYIVTGLKQVFWPVNSCLTMSDIKLPNEPCFVLDCDKEPQFLCSEEAPKSYLLMLFECESCPVTFLKFHGLSSGHKTSWFPKPDWHSMPVN